MIKPSKKLKQFFWKRQILEAEQLDPNGPADKKKNILWERVDHKLTLDVSEIETLYEDARANKA